MVGISPPAAQLLKAWIICYSKQAMKLRDWLLPSRQNKYHPHLLRPTGLALVVVLLLGINLAYNLSSAHRFAVLGAATDINATDVISLTNQNRTNNGLVALHTNSRLTAAAQAKAKDMFAKDYWAHDSPDGKTPWDFIVAAGYSYSTAGENLAKDFDTSAGVVNAWMNSAEHRANILNKSFVDVGVAVMNGTLQGETTTLVVALYASPAPVKAASPTVAPSQPTASPPSTPAASQSSLSPAKSSLPKTQPKTATASRPPTAKPVAPLAASKTTTQVASPTAAKQLDDERDVSFRRSRTWAANASLFILSTLLLVSILKHTIVWRTKRRGLRHIWLRAHPAAQYLLIITAIAANLISGVGTVR